MTYYFLNEDKTFTPCDLTQWGAQLKDHKVRRVVFEKVEGFDVSTVWIGMDMEPWIEGPLKLFETMVFSPDGDSEYQDRHTTYEQAIEGHKYAVEWVKTQALL